jgi:1-acyl-sn-glycerol-3-phosphate acyltransferase
VLLAVGRCRLVAKTEVRNWPVIGKVAASTGTIFIDRVRPKSLPGTVAAVRTRLAQGAVMAAFPEGTTSCGQGVGAFRPALFQAALDAGTPVVPVRLCFQAGPDTRPVTAAAFIGEDNLLDSLRRVLAVRGLRARVHAGTAIHPDAAATRAALARLAGDAVRAEWPVRTSAAPATTNSPHPPSAVRVPHLTLLDGGSGADTQRKLAAGSGSATGLTSAA